MRLPTPGEGEVREWVARSWCLHQAGEQRRLRPGECSRGHPEVAATGCLQAIISMTKIGDSGINLDNLRLGIAQGEFDAKQDLLRFRQCS